jgi:adenylate kinase family enzyme
MKYSTILLFGAPGAGKGTQGKVLGTVPNYNILEVVARRAGQFDPGTWTFTRP